MFLQLIQPTYRSTSRAHAVVSIETFLLLLFAATPDSSCASFRFVSCPRTVVWAQARRVLPKWVHGRTGFTSNAHANGTATHRRGVTMIILSRSLPTIQPIYRYLYYFLNLSHDFG